MNKGIVYAVLAAAAWGLLPMYWKLFEGVSSIEVLGHRIVWSFVFVIMLLFWMKRKMEWRSLFRSKPVFWYTFFASVVISVNWLMMVVAVELGRIVESSLGYYLTPVVNIVLGVIILKERPKPLQWAAIGLATAGVLLMAVSYGKLPWIGLTIAFSFGFYGLLKKKAPVDEMQGLFWETSLVLPFAFLYLTFSGSLAEPFQLTNSFFLLLAGVATALPLLWYAKATRRLLLSTVGVISYLGPTLSLLIGVFLYHEPFTILHVWGFILIWAALALFTIATVKRPTKTKQTQSAPSVKHM